LSCGTVAEPLHLLVAAFAGHHGLEERGQGQTMSQFLLLEQRGDVRRHFGHLLIGGRSGRDFIGLDASAFLEGGHALRPHRSI
jgi:hypothetical protein